MLAAVTAQPPLRRFTRDEYDRLVGLGFFARERVELIHGMLVEMSPIGPPHRGTIDRLAKLLLPRLLGRAEVSIQQPFAAWDESEPEPDVSILPPGDYSTAHPDRAHLLIEVADSSLDFDRRIKAPLYAASGVPEYWLINLVERIMEVYSEPLDGTYRRVERLRAGATIAPRAFPDVTVAVSDLIH